MRLRSALGGRPLAPGDVLLLDTLGELPAVYAAAAVAFVGGRLAPVGGHNLIEPIFAGCPVLFGPHVHNVRVHAEVALSSGAGTRVENAEELAKAVVATLRTTEIPVSYRKRVGVSKITGTISGTVKASAKILWTIARYALRTRMLKRHLATHRRALHPSSSA